MSIRSQITSGGTNMNYIGKAADYVSNKAREVVVAGAMGIALLAGCTTPSSRLETIAESQSVESRAYEGLGSKEKLDYLKARATQYMKDGAITQDEISGILGDKKRAVDFKSGIKGTDAVSTAMSTEAQSIADKLDGYIANLAKDQRAKVRVVVYTKDDANASVRIWGIYKNQHFTLDGTVEQIAKDLNVSVYELFEKAQAGSGWGELPGTDLGSDDKKASMRKYLVFVPTDKHDAVLAHVKEELKNDAGERLTTGDLTNRQKAGQVRHYSLVVEIEQVKKPEAQQEKTPEQILIESTRDRAAAEELKKKSEKKEQKKGLDQFKVGDEK